MIYDIRIDKFSTCYYVNNLLHRDDGPAVEFIDGEKHWYKNGSLHRENGPAVEYSVGSKEWYLNGKCYGIDNTFTNDSWKKFVKTLIFS